MKKPSDKSQDTPVDESHSWAVAESRDLTGRTLGDFRVERLLGLGGMGEVYLAHQVSLDRQIALKVLKPALLSNPTYLGRFEAEAWAVAKLNHPNIVHVYALGEFEGIRYIAMEYVQGTNLRDFLAKKGVPEVPIALAMMRQAGLAVQAAGEAGLVHRDIKPDNLLLTRKGQLKIADFGLARGAESERVNLTQTGVTLGTPLYMSPEQAQGHALDHRSDLYSLGVTFYHLLAGFPPFKGETGLAVALKHIREAPVSLSVHRPDLPADLCALVMKLIEKDPGKRYQTAQEMLRDIAKVRESMQTVAASAVSVSTAQSSVARTPTQAVTSANAGHPKQSISIRINGRVISACAAIGLAIGAVSGWLARADDLLGPSAPIPSARPGLWMADWASIAKSKTVESQYQLALLRVPEGKREAAWLAVPGHFSHHEPGSLDYDSKAYVQLVRYLVRRKDREHLAVLGSEFGRLKNLKDLSLLTAAAVSALQDDEGGLEAFEQLRVLWKEIDKFSDPTRIELMLEIALEAKRKSPDNARLKDLIREMIQTLQIPMSPDAISFAPIGG